MALSEAAELVIQAGALSFEPKKGSQAAPIYLLDMGKPIKFWT